MPLAATARVERRLLALRAVPYHPEHLGGRGLVELDVGIDRADPLEHARHPEGRELTRQQRLVPRGGHERLSRQVVDLPRLDLFQHRDDGQLIQQVHLVQGDPVTDVRDALELLDARAAAILLRIQD